MRNVFNLTANLTSFIVTFAISFFLSPYIVRTLGIEANGVLGVIANIVSYASILTVVISSVSNRFITIELQQKNLRGAQEYYTSTYVGNLLLFAVLTGITLTITSNLDTWLEIPTHLVNDAKLYTALLFSSLLLRLALPRWSIGTWATNKLYLDSLRDVQSVIIRALIIIILFYAFAPAISFVGYATFAATIFTLAYSAYYKAQLTPELKLSSKAFNLTKLKEVIIAGSWGSLNQTGHLLNNAFHLVLTNLFVGATAMGALSLALTVPTMANQLSINISSIFQPSLTFAHSQGNKPLLRQQVSAALIIVSLLSLFPISILTAFGDSFFKLWVPGEDATRLYHVAIGASCAMISTMVTFPLQNLFIVTNKQRSNSLFSIVFGLINLVLAVILLETTSLGVFAVLLSAAASSSFRALFGTTRTAAKILEVNTMALLKEVLRAASFLLVFSTVGVAVRMFVDTGSWLSLLFAVALTAAVGLSISIFTILRANERTLLLSIVRRLWSRVTRSR